MVISVHAKTCMQHIRTTKRLPFYHGANTCYVFLAMSGRMREIRIWNIRVRTDCPPAYTNTEWMKTMMNRPQPTTVYEDILLGMSHCPYRK